MSNEQKSYGLPLDELSQLLQKTRNAAAEHYRELMVSIHFPQHGEVTEETQEESKIIKRSTPHEPAVILYKDGTMEEVNDGMYEALSEPRSLIGQDYIKTSETIFQSLVPQDPKLKSNRCI